MVYAIRLLMVSTQQIAIGTMVTVVPRRVLRRYVDNIRMYASILPQLNHAPWLDLLS
jgi:hypothetical protein